MSNISAKKVHKGPKRRHRRFKSNIENKLRNVRVTSKLAFYEKFQGREVSPQTGRAAVVKKNFIVKRRKKTANQMRDPIRARCPFYAKVLYDFDGENADELTIKKGELLSVTIVSPNKWCLCIEKNGEEGWIPISYIERVHPKLDTELALQAAENELKALQKKIDKTKAELEAAIKRGDKKEIARLSQLLSDLTRRKALADHRVKAYRSAARAMSSRSKAQELLKKAQDGNVDAKKVEEAKKWLAAADQSVKEALEILASNKGLEAATAALQRAEEAAAKAEKEALAAIAAGADEKEVEKKLIPVRARLLRARQALRTLKAYEDALTKRQEANLMILKFHEGDKSIDIKAALRAREDYNEQAIILKAAAEAALEEMAAEEQIARLRPLVEQLRKQAFETKDPKIMEELKTAEAALKNAELRAKAAGDLRRALEAQAKALEEVQLLLRQRENGEFISEAKIKAAKAMLAECIKCTKAAAEAYKKVFGKNPLSGDDAMFESGGVMDKLEEMLSESAHNAPVRPSSDAYGNAHKLILKAIQTCKVLNEARLKAAIEVFVSDLEAIRVAACGDAHTAEAIIDYLDSHHIRCASLEDMIKEIKKLGVSWAAEKKFASALFKSEKNWDVKLSEIDLIFNRSLAGEKTCKYLKETPGSWTNTCESVIEYLQGCVERDHLKISDAREQCMVIIQQLLSGKAYTIHMRQFALLFRQGISTKEVLARLQTLKKSNKEFEKFEEILADVLQRKMIEAPKRIERVESDKLGVKHRVLRYITNSKCSLFSSPTLRVQASVMKDIISAFPDPNQVTTDLAVLQASNKKFPSFLALSTALIEDQCAIDRKAFEETLKKIESFSSDPERVLRSICESCPHHLKGAMKILGDLSLSNSAGKAVVEVKTAVVKLLSREAKEISAAIDFLSKESLFTQETSIRKPQLVRIVHASLFSAHGLKSGSISSLLEDIKKEDCVFESVEGLANALSKKASKA